MVFNNEETNNENGMILMCCPGCKQWYHPIDDEQMEHYVCPSCGTETYSEEWIASHPKHKDYQAYLKWKEEYPNG